MQIAQNPATEIWTVASAGEFGLDEPIDRFQPDVTSSWKPITMRQLMHQTAGVGR
jgi:CubicO group peptidase (beta-lactamase class C family)